MLLLQRQRFPEIDVDGFDIGVASGGVKCQHLKYFACQYDVLVQGVLALLASHTRLLVPSERHVRIQRVDAVDPQSAGL